MTLSDQGLQNLSGTCMKDGIGVQCLIQVSGSDSQHCSSGSEPFHPPPMTVTISRSTPRIHSQDGSVIDPSGAHRGPCLTCFKPPVLSYPPSDSRCMVWNDLLSSALVISHLILCQQTHCSSKVAFSLSPEGPPSYG